jgi:hypothetical protein
MVKKQQLVSLIAPLAQLGVPAPAMRQEVVRLFDLPPTFNEVETPAPEAAPAAAMGAPTEAPTPEAATSAVIGGA